MKTVLTLVLLAFATGGLAQSGHDAHRQMEEPATAQSHPATGVVTKVDAPAGRVTIRHDPVPSLKWPAMTMAFKVKDKKMLDALKPGAKVSFRFEQQGKDYVITELR